MGHWEWPVLSPKIFNFNPACQLYSVLFCLRVSMQKTREDASHSHPLHLQPQHKMLILCGSPAHLFHETLNHLSLPFLSSQPGVEVAVKGMEICAGLTSSIENILPAALHRAGALQWSKGCQGTNSFFLTHSYVLWVSSALQAQVGAESFRRCSPVISSAGQQVLISSNGMQIYF